MKTYRIVFERKVILFCRGEVSVTADSIEDADNMAEDALMRGDVDLNPELSTLEYDRDNCAIIIIRKVTS